MDKNDKTNRIITLMEVIFLLFSTSFNLWSSSSEKDFKEKNNFSKIF